MSGNQDDIRRYEAQNAAALARSAKSMKLVYYAMGKEDFLYDTVAPTRALFDRAGISHLYNESGGGHTWINWRRYLAILRRDCSGNHAQALRGRRQRLAAQLAHRGPERKPQ